jgi:hypothetical protein
MTQDPADFDGDDDTEGHCVRPSSPRTVEAPPAATRRGPRP